MISKSVTLSNFLYIFSFVAFLFGLRTAQAQGTYNESINVTGGGTLSYQYQTQTGECNGLTQTSRYQWSNFAYTPPSGTSTPVSGSIWYLVTPSTSTCGITGGWDSNGSGSTNGNSNVVTMPYGTCTITFDASEGSATGNASISSSNCASTAVQGFVNPKFVIVGVTYAPPGPSSSITYTGTTSIGNTTTISNSFSEDIGFSVSVAAKFSGVVATGSITGTESTDYTQGSSSATTTTISKLTSLAYKTMGTGNAFSPVSHDYDTIWLWLNPVVMLTYTPGTSSTPAGIQWNGYGFDTTDPSGTYQPDVEPVLVGYLNGDFGSNPSINAILARSWATGQTWPTGEGPGLTTADITNIIAADPLTNSSYSLLQFYPYTTSDGRFTLMEGPNSPNPIPYEQAGPGNGGGLTTIYSVTQTNTQSVAQGSSSGFKQAFGMEEVFGGTLFGTGVTTTLKQSDTLNWTNSTLSTLTTTTTLQDALSVTGPGCPALPPGPCSPEYAGPGQFLLYQDNQYGTFMFYPAN